jgi:hypothetical protein
LLQIWQQQRLVSYGRRVGYSDDRLRAAHQAEVAQATGNSIAFSKKANAGSVSSYTFGSLS